jgi:fibronectin type 3 domain-containing protein
MVQIGNEITPGLLSPTIGGSWEKVARILNSGALAVRLAAPDAKIMLHLDRGGDTSAYQTWFDRFARHGSTAATTTEVDFDVVGLSWYPYYSSHKTIDDLDTNIRNIRSRYGKEAVVAETGWAWTIAYDGDELSNLFHITQENQTAVQMTDGKGYVTASGIGFETREGGETKYLPASPENQAKLLRAVMDATAGAGGGGVFWWAGDWIPATGLRSNWDNQTLFDFNGKALPALSVLGGLSSTAGTIPPQAPGNLRLTSATIDSITLAWDASYGADKYAVYRAGAAEGPWTALDETVTGTTYADTGLVPGTAYYYQAKAHNEHGWGSPAELTAQTPAPAAPANFRVTGSTGTSISLAWDARDSATGYKIYHAQSATEPADTAYTLLPGNIAAGTTTYEHTSLGSSETHYYKISALFGSHGEGPRSGAINAATGAPPPSYATVDMATGTLDADFTNSSKAAWVNAAGDSLAPSNSANYDIKGLYVANDANNLYIALDFDGSRPSGYTYDRLIVMIDNTASSAGSANTAVNAAQTQNLADGTSIEAYAMQRMTTTVTGTVGVAGNVSSWAGGDEAANWLYTPGSPAGAAVIKFSIPLAAIAGSASGTQLRVFAAFSQGWSTGSNIVVGDLIPAAAVTTGGTVDSGTIIIDMSQALAYTVK